MTEASLARFNRRQRRVRFQQRQQRAVRCQLAESYHGGYGLPPFALPPALPALPLSLCRGDHIITIVTTACLPWLTGTSINPLLRGAYLEQYYGMRVTILFPWISPADQRSVYSGTVFADRSAQGQYVIDWLNRRLGITTRVRVLFYDAWHDPRKGSILPLDRSDVTEHILASESDVAVLEEPEHLTWYHMVGPKWRTKFALSVGVAHTNYTEYIRRDRGEVAATFVTCWNWLMVRANCHRVIRLSAAVQPFAHSTVCNVHGVSPQFLEEQEVDKEGRPSFPRGAYFIGKVGGGGRGGRRTSTHICYRSFGVGCRFCGARATASCSTCCSCTPSTTASPPAQSPRGWLGRRRGRPSGWTCTAAGPTRRR